MVTCACTLFEGDSRTMMGQWMPGHVLRSTLPSIPQFPPPLQGSCSECDVLWRASPASRPGPVVWWLVHQASDCPPLPTWLRRCGTLWLPLRQVTVSLMPLVCLLGLSALFHLIPGTVLPGELEWALHATPCTYPNVFPVPPIQSPADAMDCMFPAHTRTLSLSLSFARLLHTCRAEGISLVLHNGSTIQHYAMFSLGQFIKAHGETFGLGGFITILESDSDEIHTSSWCTWIGNTEHGNTEHPHPAFKWLVFLRNICIPFCEHNSGVSSSVIAIASPSNSCVISIKA